MLGRRAGSGVGYSTYIVESPKQGSKRLNFITKTIHFAHLLLYYLSMAIAKKNLLVTIFLAKIIIKIYTVIYSLEENGLIRKAKKSS